MLAEDGRLYVLFGRCCSVAFGGVGGLVCCLMFFLYLFGCCFYILCVFFIILRILFLAANLFLFLCFSSQGYGL